MAERAALRLLLRDGGEVAVAAAGDVMADMALGLERAEQGEDGGAGEPVWQAGLAVGDEAGAGVAGVSTRKVVGNECRWG